MSETEEVGSTASKWEQYHASGSPPPWEGAGTTPQLSTLLKQISAAVSVHDKAALELGCGSGLNVLHFADAGFKVAVGNELAPSAIAKCKANEAIWLQSGAGEGHSATAAEGSARGAAADLHGANGRIEWVQGDMLQVFSEEKHTAAYDFVFDCQVFHVMRDVDEDAFVRLVQRLLAPGGLYVTVAGNAHEKARSPGPPVLTAPEVVAPLEAAGLQLLRLQRTEFAPTPSYGSSPPLAWLAVFTKAQGRDLSPMATALLQ